MPLPVGWPPRVCTGRRSIRFYKEGTATALFEDNAYLFVDGLTANTYTPLPFVAPGSNVTVNVSATPTGTSQIAEDANAVNGASPKAMIWSKSIRIFNDSAADLEFSFDGVNVHGVVKPADTALFYWDRFEAGIAVRGLGAFRVEAW